MNLTQLVRLVRLNTALAVGTSTINSPGQDMTGIETCMFVVLWGAITDAPDVTVQQSDDDGDADDYTNVLNSLVTVATGTADGITWVEIHNPEKRYVRISIARGGATGSVIDGILAVLGGFERPPAQSAGEFHDHAADEE